MNCRRKSFILCWENYANRAKYICSQYTILLSMRKTCIKFQVIMTVFIWLPCHQTHCFYRCLTLHYSSKHFHSFQFPKPPLSSWIHLQNLHKSNACVCKEQICSFGKQLLLLPLHDSFCEWGYAHPGLPGVIWQLDLFLFSW